MFLVKLLKLYILCLISIYLFGCGGGGGSSANKNQQDAASEIESFNAEQAEIRRSNALRYLYANQQLVDAVNAFRGDVLGFFLPPLADHDSILADEILCPEGTYEIRETKKSLRARFYNCINRGYHVDGEVNYTSSGNVDSGSFSAELRFNGFYIATENNEIVYDGVLYSSLDPHEYTIGGNSELRFTDNLTGNSYAWSEITANRLSLSAKLHDKNTGWVTVSYDQDSEKIEFVGANASRLEGETTFDPDGTIPSKELQTYQLTLFNEESDLPQRFNQPIPINALKNVEHQTHSSPEPHISGNTSPDRLDSVDFSGSQSQDSNYDVFTYKWQSSEAPKDCNTTIEGDDRETATFVFSCQGEHVVSLTVTDWTGSNTEYFTVDVQPLAAELSTPQTITLAEGQSLDVSLEVSNLSQDGPYQYSLIAAPNGISIDQSGHITGEPIPFLDEGDTRFKVVARADNGRQSDHVFEFQYHNTEVQKTLVSGTALCLRDGFRHFADTNGNGFPNLVCANEESFKVIEVKNDQISTIYSSPASYSPNYELVDVGQQDLNGDGIDEILLAYDDRIFVLSGEGYQIISEFVVPWRDTSSANPDRVRYQLHPIAEGAKSIAVSAPKSPDFGKNLYLFNLDGSYLSFDSSTHGDRLLLANIDNDPEPEAWVVYDHIKQTKFIDYGNPEKELPFNAQFIADIDGNDRPELVVITQPDTGNTEIISLYDPQTGILQYQSELTINVDYYRSDIQLLNVDDDNAYEVLLRDEIDKTLYIFDWINEELQLQGSYPESAEGNYLAYYGGLPNGVLLDYDPKASVIFQLDKGHRNLQRTSPRSLCQSQIFPRSSQRLGCYATDQFPGMGKVEILSNGKIASYRAFSEAQFDLAHMTELYDGDQIVSSYFGLGGSGKTHRLMDSYSETIIGTTTFAITSNFFSYTKGDIDGDGLVNTVAFGDEDGEIQWFSITEDELHWEDIDSSYRDGEFPLQVVDLDGDGKDEIVAIRNRVAATDQYEEISLFRFNGITLELDRQYALENPNGGYTFGIQDIDGDGSREIIVAERDAYGCKAGEKLSDVYVFRGDLTLQQSLEISECITSIPNFPVDVSKQNIIVAVTREQSLSGARRLRHVKLVEFGIRSPEILWESQRFLGNLKEDGFMAFPLGKDSDLKATLSTSAGVYFLR